MPPKHHHPHDHDHHHGSPGRGGRGRHGGRGRGHDDHGPGRGRGRGRGHHSPPPHERDGSPSPPHHPPPHHDHDHDHHHDHHHHHHHHDHSPPPSPPHHHHHHHHHPYEEEPPPPPPPQREAEEAAPAPEEKIGGSSTAEEKKEDEDDVDVSKLNLDVDPYDKKNASQNKKNTFQVTKTYGGNGDPTFDHGNNRHISKITLHTDGHVIHSMEIMYNNKTGKGPQLAVLGNKTHAKQKETFLLNPTECITYVKVRSNKLVQSLMFRTNTGRQFGPVGGEGFNGLLGIGKDSKGEEMEIFAPFKKQLCGFIGSHGDSLQSIGFRWGPLPPSKK